MGFKENFETKVKNTIEKYKLLDKKDKILVACSGGKDSTTILYLLNEFSYKVEALIIDLLMGDWSQRNLDNLSGFCKKQKIKLNVINIRHEFGCSVCYMRSNIQAKVKIGNCSICGVIRRWLLNKKARELKANKLVTGHNLDDEAENVVMNMFKGNPKMSVSLGPKRRNISNKFVQRVKPLYFCTNEEIREYSKLMDFPVVYESCPCSSGAYRKEVRKFILELEKGYPNLKLNIVKNFLRILPLFRKHYISKDKIKYCDNCGEPSRNDICRRCELTLISKKK